MFHKGKLLRSYVPLATFIVYTHLLCTQTMRIFYLTMKEFCNFFFIYFFHPFNKCIIEIFYCTTPWCLNDTQLTHCKICMYFLFQIIVSVSFEDCHSLFGITSKRHYKHIYTFLCENINRPVKWRPSTRKVLLVGKTKSSK